MKLKPKLLSLLQHRKKEFPRERIIADLTAGLVVACIALPLSIALAIASGVTPDKGLITAVVAGFTISLLGGSRVQIAGPTGAFVVIVYGIIQQYGMQGLLVSTLLAGIILIIMGCLKFGAFLKFIPYPVTTGFTSGIAVVLFSTQINDFLGLGLSEIPSAFFAKWQFYFNNISHTSMPTLFMGLLALVLIVFWPKKFKLFPGSLAALVITTLIVKVCDLPVATIGSTFGTIKTGLITPHFPDINFDIILKLLRPAFTIAFLAGIESLLSAVVADGMIGKKHRSNMELVATGCGNIVSALFGGLPATGAIARTAANIDNGGRTPLAGIAHSIFLLIMMLCLMNYISLIPMTALATILFNVSYRMSDWRSFVSLFKAPASDILVLMVTFALTVVIDLVAAIEFGLVLAAILFMKRMADVYNVTNTDDDIMDEVHHKDDIDAKKIAKHVTVYEINGPFFFGAANLFIDTLSNMKDCKVLVLRMRSVPAMDATGYHALYKIYKRCHANGVKIILSHLQRQPQKMLNKYGFLDIIGKANICKNIDESLMRAEKIISSAE
ncbi:MAG: STAS domain-containing protein [Elusimicrobiaceae bacterium]|nr:STAS domain-containing protein [Elusimicrobiaceae bacterium]